jgi:hypothetical protein
MAKWVGEKIGRVFAQQPDRVAAAWRRVRWSTLYLGTYTANALDDVVESFVREIGATLEGAAGPAWSRCRGVLRLSRARGARALAEEFDALRRCLIDASDALGGTDREREIIRGSVDQALQSALEQHYFLFETGKPPAVPFGGLVVEKYERPAGTPMSDRVTAELQ